MHIIYNILIIAAWFIVFTIGVKVNTTILDESTGNMFLFLVASTATNIGILAVLASLIGNTMNVMLAIRRGFTIYACIASGSIVMFTESFVSPTLEQYVKIATSVSAICIVVSFRPQLFDRFLDFVSQTFKGEGDRE